MVLGHYLINSDLAPFIFMPSHGPAFPGRAPAHFRTTRNTIANTPRRSLQTQPPAPARLLFHATASSQTASHREVLRFVEKHRTRRRVQAARLPEWPRARS